MSVLKERAANQGVPLSQVRLPNRRLNVHLEMRLRMRLRMQAGAELDPHGITATLTW